MGKKEGAQWCQLVLSASAKWPYMKLYNCFVNFVVLHCFAKGKGYDSSKKLESLKNELETNQRDLSSFLDDCALAVKLG